MRTACEGAWSHRAARRAQAGEWLCARHYSPLISWVVGLRGCAALKDPSALLRHEIAFCLGQMQVQHAPACIAHRERSQPRVLGDARVRDVYIAGRDARNEQLATHRGGVQPATCPLHVRRRSWQAASHQHSPDRLPRALAQDPEAVPVLIKLLEDKNEHPMVSGCRQSPLPRLDAASGHARTTHEL